MSRTEPAGTPLGDRFHLYDTTLRDGAQRAGISYSIADKFAVARLLDDLGVGFIEGGWPGAMPKDTEFFARAAAGELTLRHAVLVAFGSTRRAGLSVTEDPQVRALLAEDGVMLLHSIGRVDGPGSTNSWIAKYIFPGGYAPALSEIVTAVEKAGLIITDVEVLRLHYAQTLKEWRRRFMANRAEAARIYDDRFCRMWEFYLAGAEMAFRHDGEVVFQVQIVRRQDAVPLTRDYMLEEERTMRFAGTEKMPLHIVQ